MSWLRAGCREVWDSPFGGRKHKALHFLFVNSPCLLTGFKSLQRRSHSGFTEELMDRWAIAGWGRCYRDWEGGCSPLPCSVPDSPVCPSAPCPRFQPLCSVLRLCLLIEKHTKSSSLWKPFKLKKKKKVSANNLHFIFLMALQPPLVSKNNCSQQGLEEPSFQITDQMFLGDHYTVNYQ